MRRPIRGPPPPYHLPAKTHASIRHFPPKGPSCASCLVLWSLLRPHLHTRGGCPPAYLPHLASDPTKRNTTQIAILSPRGALGFIIGYNFFLLYLLQYILFSALITRLGCVSRAPERHQPVWTDVLKYAPRGCVRVPPHYQRDVQQDHAVRPGFIQVPELGRGGCGEEGKGGKPGQRRPRIRGRGGNRQG